MRVLYNKTVLWDEMLIDTILTPTANGFKIVFQDEDEFGNPMDFTIELTKLDLQQLKNHELFSDPLI